MVRWLRIFLLVLGVVGLVLLTLPWWLGAILNPVLQARGVTFDRYVRQGYAHFQLERVHYAAPGFIFSAESVRTSTPLLWLVQRLRGGEPALVVDKWRLQRNAPHEKPPAPPRIQGLPDLRAMLKQSGPRLANWLPRVHLTEGEVHGYGPDLTIARAGWEKSVLTVEDLMLSGRRLSLELRRGANHAITLTAHTAENDARLQLEWSDAEIKGEATLWDQPLQLFARFPAKGWMPTEAGAVAEHWELPAARLKLGAPYARVKGDAQLVWREKAFNLSANARAEPAADGKTKAPPFEARATAQGNLRELTLTALHLDAPFGTARLTAPVTFSLDRPVAAESAQLTVQADLAKVPGLEEARGRMEGVVTVAGDTSAARQKFELRFSDVILRGVALKEAQADGILTWPKLELSRLHAQLDETSSLEARGTMDWQARELEDVAVTAKLGSAWFARWLPPGAGWETAELSATAKGPLDAPRHEGSFKIIAARWPHLQPLAVESSWQGTGKQVEISAQAAAEKSTLALAGTLEPGRLRLTQLQTTAEGRPQWQLAAPAELAWLPVWQINALQLTAADSRLTMQGRGGEQGTFELTATNFASTQLQPWIALPGPAWTVHSLQATGRVENRRLVFDTALTGQIGTATQPAQIKLTAHGDAEGIALKEFQVGETGRMLTQATGRLPLSWIMDPRPRLQADENASLELSASTEPDSPLWTMLAGFTGVQLEKPAAKLELKGTLRQPLGEIHIQAGRLGTVPGRFKFSLPEIGNLNLALQFDRGKIAVPAFTAQLDGQPVQAHGSVPMSDEDWENLWRTPTAFDWSKAEGRVELTDANLASFAQHFPRFFLAQGRLSARVQLSPGSKFSGELHLTDAVSRPLAAFGSLRDIRADLVLADRLVTVQAMTGHLGGEPVTVGGSATLVPRGAPRLDLTLKGQNLPVVRNTGLLLRSDLDLRLRTDDSGVTRLSGIAAVRDCLVLTNVNLRTLLPGGRRGAARQPPYFAVEAAPFRDWALAVDIRGPGAVRVRTTAYSGTASAYFQLGGTLGEPRAVGQLTVDRGQVLFPFATFAIQQGSVRLREADPFHAVVDLNATSQRRDYQLRLEMTGQLPAPNIVISSTPALEAAEVLLMVMTGQPPASDTKATGASGARLAALGAYFSRGLFQDLGFSNEDRLEISAGERVSRQGRDTYEFEYRLGEHWSLLGEYDQYDSYNAGLKWRVYTQESTPREEK